jgi:hypothetical protein
MNLLDAVHFFDESEGWIVGFNGRTLKNDGNEWTVLLPDPACSDNF